MDQFDLKYKAIGISDKIREASEDAEEVVEALYQEIDRLKGVICDKDLEYQQLKHDFETLKQVEQ